MSEEAKKERGHLEKFRELVEIFKGKVPLKRKLDPLMNPDDIRTATDLTPNQVRFVSNSYWLAKTFPMFEGLQTYADNFMYPVVSKKGRRVDQAIEFMRAVTEHKILKKAETEGVKVSG